MIKCKKCNDEIGIVPCYLTYIRDGRWTNTFFCSERCLKEFVKETKFNLV